MPDVDQQAIDIAMNEYRSANMKKSEHLRLVAVHNQRAADEQANADSADSTVQIARQVLILFGLDPDTL